MLNIERYKDEILEKLKFGSLYEAIYIVANQKGFNITDSYELFNWLLKESKKIEFKPYEKSILKEIDKDYKYIARDLDGGLFLYKNNPIKNPDCWKDYICNRLDLNAFRHLFNFIKWEDACAFEIEYLLDCEVSEGCD